VKRLQNKKPMFLCGKNSKIALSLQQLENIFTFKKFFIPTT